MQDNGEQFMTNPQTVPDLIAAARDNAKVLEDTISGVQEDLNGSSESETQAEHNGEAVIALKLAAVDVFTLFEARMQHHFKRGPFSKKLETALLSAGHTDLATRIHGYYLAINVLKHGTGASYRELRSTSNRLFRVNSSEGIDTEIDHASLSLLDIDVPGFFEGLGTTLLEANQFLESR